MTPETEQTRSGYQSHGLNSKAVVALNAFDNST